MFDSNKIQGIIFDYGGTIDSNGKHWAEVIWEAYEAHNVDVTKEQFREAFAKTERYLAVNHVIEVDDDFLVLLQKKISLQLDYLVDNGYLQKTDKISEYKLAIPIDCYKFAKRLIESEKEILDKLHEKYPMVLVSNFYGNVSAVLKDFGLYHYFDHIIESAVVGIRKPDPAIFALGVEKLNMPAENIVVIGDSHTKDIIPATMIGCQTIWLKGLGWEKDDESAAADVIITDFKELEAYLP